MIPILEARKFKEDITMGMVVQHNMNALNAYNKLNTNVAGLKKSSEKLSSGYRINRAGDDAAGLAISEKMRSQIRGLTQAKRNSQDGISMIQTFEGATQESHSILQRMKELATESANGTYQNEVDRDAIQLEFNQLNDELDQIADTDFNGTVMLNGGQMADGLKAANGKFDYANSERSAMQIGDASGLIIGIGTDSNNTTDAKAGTVTFTATKFDDGTVTWQASNGAKGELGNGVVDSKTQPTKGTAGKAVTGGFVYNGVSVNIDTDKVVSGDTITIKFSAKQEATGKKSEITGTSSDWGAITQGKATSASLDISTGVNAPTSKAIADAMNYLNKVTIEQSWTGTGAAKATVNKGSTKINGVAVDDTAVDKLTTLTTFEDGSRIEYKNKTADTVEGGILQFVDKDGNTTQLATVKSGVDGGNAAGEWANGSGTVKTEIYTSKASFTPAAGTGVEVMQPSGKVSQANSNSTATAPLTYTDQLTLQTGARTKDSVNFTFSYSTDGMGELKANLDVSSRENGLNTKNLSLATAADANTAIDKIDNAINKVSMVRATFGATQNRLEHKIENLTTTNENLTEAESGIRDTDMAQEMLNYTKYNVLQQAAQSMLAQANQQPQSILQLLG